MLLEDACAIRSGFSARSRLAEQRSGLLALNQGCVTASGQLDLTAAAFVATETGSLTHRVHAGDVLLRSRGNTASATAIDAPLPAPAIALLPLYILRPAADILDPGYLAWLVMQPAAQAHFARESVGSNIQMIKRPVIAALPLGHLPPLDRQRGIAELALLAVREQTLESRLAALKHERITLQLQAQATAPHNDRNHR